MVVYAGCACTRSGGYGSTSGANARNSSDNS